MKETSSALAKSVLGEAKIFRSTLSSVRLTVSQCSTIVNAGRSQTVSNRLRGSPCRLREFCYIRVITFKFNGHSRTISILSKILPRKRTCQGISIDPQYVFGKQASERPFNNGIEKNTEKAYINKKNISNRGQRIKRKPAVERGCRLK